MGTLRRSLRAADWLGRERVLGYGGILLALELLTFLFFVAGTHGWIVPLSEPSSTDFVSFYAAGSLADAGTPALAYDQAAHYAAEQQATAPGIPYQFFFYPPVFLLLCAPLARLPYLGAFFLFEAATLPLYLLAARGILRQRSWAVLLPLLAFPSVFWTLGLGQNAFLTAALFGAATLLVDRRPASAGLLFGALCYKPHFGLLIPVALAAGGRWRAFAAAAASAVALVALSVALFGWQSWQAFFATAAGSHGTFESGRIDLAGMVTPFAAILLAGGTRALAYAAQIAATIAAAALVAQVWRRGLSLPIRAAALAAGTLAAIPVALIYDLMLALVAGLWLVRNGRENGFLPWEKSALALLFLVPLVSRSIGTIAHLPVAPLAVLVLLGFIALHAAREAAARDAGSGAGYTGLASISTKAR